jgi:hypothetical protein
MVQRQGLFSSICPVFRPIYYVNKYMIYLILKEGMETVVNLDGTDDFMHITEAVMSQN